MAASTTLLQFLLMVVAGWLHRQQSAVIDYRVAGNRLLRGRLGDRRIIFTDAERRQLAAKAKAVGSGVRHECLSRLIPIGQGMLRRALRDYEAHFHHERNHQGLGNVLIMPRVSSAHRVGRVIRHPRLGGLLNYYERAAA